MTTARGEAVAPAGPRARPREGSPAPVDFSQEDQRAKGARANPIPRDGGRVALAHCPAGQAGELARRRGRRSGVNRSVDRLRLSVGGTGPIGPGYRREGAGCKGGAGRFASSPVPRPAVRGWAVSPTLVCKRSGFGSGLPLVSLRMGQEGEGATVDKGQGAGVSCPYGIHTTPAR